MLAVAQGRPEHTGCSGFTPHLYFSKQSPQLRALLSGAYQLPVEPRSPPHSSYVQHAPGPPHCLSAPLLNSTAHHAGRGLGPPLPLRRGRMLSPLQPRHGASQPGPLCATSIADPTQQRNFLAERTKLWDIFRFNKLSRGQGKIRISQLCVFKHENYGEFLVLLLFSWQVIN